MYGIHMLHVTTLGRCGGGAVNWWDICWGMEYAIYGVFDILNSWLVSYSLILNCIQDIFQKNKKSHMKMNSCAATGQETY